MTTLSIKKIRLTKEAPVVCVPVVAAKKEEIIEHIANLARERVRMIEWRLDCYEDWSDLESVSEVLLSLEGLIDNTMLLLTLRTRSEGGNADISANALMEYYTGLSRLPGYDLIDIQYNDTDKDTAEAVGQSKKVTVLSFHDFSGTPDGDALDGLLEGMRTYPCDILKFAFMPHSEEDVDRAVDFSAEIRKRWHGRQVVISMGELGEGLRRNPFMTGSCFSFGCIKGEMSAPGQVYYKELTADIEMNRRKRQIIFLTGYMGTGKSTLGRELKKMTNMRLVDLDSLIEKQAGCSISRMMEEHGEGYFRDAETEALFSVKGSKNLIVACGGGIVLRDENRRFMKENGTVVLLEAAPEEIYNRIKNDTSRPLLAGKMTVDYIASMKRERDPLYNDAADITVDTGALDKFDISLKVCKTIGCCL